MNNIEKLSENKINEPFYSKYRIENFEGDVKESKYSFLVPESYEDDDLYWELV